MIKYLLLLSICIASERFVVNPLVIAAVERVSHNVKYDGSYYEIDYPNGDIPDSIGVCTDVIIRSYRNCCNIDLQELVHKDMLYYPEFYDINVEIDSNIDHRRVRNLRVYFNRHAIVFPITDEPFNYRPGNIVTWNLYDNQLPHIGIVTDYFTDDGVPYIVHNAGGGVVIEDILFKFNITGHYRFIGERNEK